QINANSGTANAMFISRISTTWTPATATWANQPSVSTTNQVSVPATTQAFLDFTDVDLKNLVNDKRTSGNNGFMISLQNETYYNVRQFCSSIYSDSTKHPKLVITYQ
ncbi:MAG: DNRLRE domain-containing protein, partial [Ferruginibacter sp.]